MTALTFPSYDSLKASIIADVQQNVKPMVNGQVVPVDYSLGSNILTLTEIVSLVMDQFFGQLQLVDLALRLSSAQGDDLDDIGALVDCARIQGAQSTAVAKFSRQSFLGATAVNIPVGVRVYAYDQYQNPVIEFSTVQDPSLNPGIAGVLPSGAQAIWLYVQATDVGTLGNVVAGQLAVIGDPIPGIDTVSNPQVASVPTGPTVTNQGTNHGQTYQYMIVANGVTGSALPSPVGQVLTGDNTPNNLITWTGVADAATYTVLRNTGTVTTPVWQQVGLTASTITSLVDNNLVPIAYALPSVNTTNTGIGGIDREADDDYRARIPTALAAKSTATMASLLGVVAAIPGVTQAFGVDAGQNGLAAGYAQIQFVGSSNPISAATLTAIINAIAATKAAGIIVSELQIVPIPVNVAYTFAAQSGVTASTLITAIDTAISNMLSSQTPGTPIRYGQIMLVIQNVAGVAAATRVAVQALVLPAPTTPTFATAGSGIPDSTTVAYRVTSVGPLGETLASTEVSATTGVGGPWTATVSWPVVPGATGYNVYGRTAGTELKMTPTPITATSFTDNNTVTPSGALPTTDANLFVNTDVPASSGVLYGPGTYTPTVGS